MTYCNQVDLVKVKADPVAKKGHLHEYVFRSSEVI